MKKKIIFAGTTEGRRLSEILADAGTRTPMRATEYGETAMREHTMRRRWAKRGSHPYLFTAQNGPAADRRILRNEGCET